MKSRISALTPRNQRSLLTALTAGLLVAGWLGAVSAAPATRTWDGGGTDDNWTNRFNWVGDIALAGDNLVFPPSSARTGAP